MNRKPGAASGTGGHAIAAVLDVLATVPAWAIAARHEQQAPPTLPACMGAFLGLVWAGYVIGGIFQQLRDEGGWSRLGREDRERSSCSGHRDIHHAALFGVGEGFRFGRDKGEKGVVDDHRWKAHACAVSAEQDDVVGLQALRGMDGLEGDRQVRMPSTEAAHVGLDKAVATQQEHRGLAAGRSRLCRQSFQAVVQHLVASLSPGPGNPDRGMLCLAGRNNCLGDLRRIAKHEAPGSQGNLVD